MKVLITGAAGYIGGRMVESMCAADWVESVVGTDIVEPQKKIGGCTYYQRDIRDNMDDICENEQVDAIIHTAYVLNPIHDTSLMEDINKNGTKNVLQTAVKNGIKQVLYTSSTTAYGFYPDNDRPLTEDSPLRGNDDFTYAKNKKEIEGIFKEFIPKHPEIKISIVRPCFVVGPGFKNPMAEAFQKKIALLPNNTLPWQFVHEDDLMDVMTLLMEKQIEGIFNVAGDGTMTFDEIISILGNIKLPLPWWLIYPLNNISWFLRLSFITKFPSPAMRMMVNPWISSNEKLKKETGYKFKYTTLEAYKDFARSV